MDMDARNQYLAELSKEYHTGSKTTKGHLLDEAQKRTGLNRKYLIRKLNRPRTLSRRPRQGRREYYDGDVVAALVTLWQIFDYPCGQRLAPLLKTEVERLRRLGEVRCRDDVAHKLTEIAPRTIDAKLKRQKEYERRTRQVKAKQHPLLYQKIPVKVAREWDRTVLGQIQIDLVEHCGQSTRGTYLHTVSSIDIASGWWEGEAIMGKGQEATLEALKRLRARFPFRWTALHSDNGTEFINREVFRYIHKAQVPFSRSRPNKKNDNAFVEQKNWTHVKKFVGYFRYDTQEELSLLTRLYRKELRLYKNFFQPVIKLIAKERRRGRIHRKYDTPTTPYHRIRASKDLSKASKHTLQQLYDALNPAELKRTIDATLDQLYEVYHQKQRKSQKAASAQKKLHPPSVTFFIAQPEAFRLPP